LSCDNGADDIVAAARTTADQREIGSKGNLECASVGEVVELFGTIARRGGESPRR
jgi:hypothetical protein